MANINFKEFNAELTTNQRNRLLTVLLQHYGLKLILIDEVELHFAQDENMNEVQEYNSNQLMEWIGENLPNQCFKS